MAYPRNVINKQKNIKTKLKTKNFKEKLILL